MQTAQQLRNTNLPPRGATEVDPFSHESTAAAVARLTALVETQQRVIRDYEAALTRSKEMFERASAAARLGMWECDLTTETLQWSGGTYDMFDIPRDVPLLRNQTLTCYPPESLRALETIRSRAIAQRRDFNLDAEIVTPKGKHRWIRITAVVDCVGDRPIRLFGFKQDITEEKAKWERLRYLAEFDELTGLANRRRFEGKLWDFCEAPAAAPTDGALLLIDLDGFKAVNDSLGHAAGDACLQQAARRLTEVSLDAIVVARIGGDEFAILFGPGGAQRIATVATQIVQAMNRPVTYRDRKFNIGASVGIAWACGCSPTELFQRADAALYAAKSSGRNTFRWFDPRQRQALA
ncbi:MAG TPA: sensor domain-containing diguanylate cyclase [Pseudolabrys sp.]|nr:sensor domain-containing diguanylate cyclase [Pseudolabrys sp.]